MTEMLMQTDFWREVGITVAARLSVVAVALWGVKMLTDHLREAAPHPKPKKTAKPAPAAPIPVYALQSSGSNRSTSHSAGPGGRSQSEVESWKKKMGKYLSGE